MVNSQPQRIETLQSEEISTLVQTYYLDQTILESHIIGHTGWELLKNQRLDIRESLLKLKLQNWLSKTGEPQLLWIQGLLESQRMTTAKAVGLRAMSTAIDNQQLFISHFCEKLEYDPESRISQTDRPSLIGMLYNLIRQLLQLHRNLSPDICEKVTKMNGSAESWPLAITILTELLRITADLRYCIIYGINLLEYIDGSAWCIELVQALLAVQKESGIYMSALFLTDGQSRVLAENLLPQHRYRSTQSVLEARK
jgi:hypothetical protein